MLQTVKQEATYIKSRNHCVYISGCVKEQKTAVPYVDILLRSLVAKLIFKRSSAVQLDIFKTDHNELCKCFQNYFNECQKTPPSLVSEQQQKHYQIYL